MPDKDWLSRNVAPILALLIVLFCFGLFVLFSVGKIDPANRDLVLMVAGGVIGTLGAVVQYFFGSSQGSARKTELLGGSPPPLPYESVATLVPSTVAPAPGSGMLPGEDFMKPEEIKTMGPAA